MWRVQVGQGCWRARRYRSAAAAHMAGQPSATTAYVYKPGQGRPCCRPALQPTWSGTLNALQHCGRATHLSPRTNGSRQKSSLQNDPQRPNSISFACRFGVRPPRLRLGAKGPRSAAPALCSKTVGLHSTTGPLLCALALTRARNSCGPVPCGGPGRRTGCRWGNVGKRREYLEESRQLMWGAFCYQPVWLGQQAEPGVTMAPACPPMKWRSHAPVRAAQRVPHPGDHGV